MNAFTKEELQLLIDVLDEHEPSPKEKGLCLNIADKVQSMIDNYCEHEFYLNGQGAQIFAQCHKCSKLKKISFYNCGAGD